MPPRPRTPNLNALRAFDAAGRHLNFARAAEELSLTQGAVAQQVRRLEADLGVRLFRRLARGLAFTEAGRGYHREVAPALARIRAATAALAPAPERVVLSLPPSLAAKWLVPRLPRFARAYPEIEVQTVASAALADLSAGGAALAIRQGSPPFQAGTQARRLAPLALVAVCSPDHPAAGVAGGGLAALAGHRLIEDDHRHWATLLRAAGLPAPDRPLVFNQTSLAMDAAAMGQGVALAPELVARGDIAAGRLVAVWRQDSESAAGFYLLRSQGSAPPAVAAVADWLMAEAGAA